MRFFCDEMLQGLGRWLRAAGYDTLIANNGETDKQLQLQAVAQGRMFITRDRVLFEQTPAQKRNSVLLLEATDLPGCLQELSERLAINWCLAPFSRCLICNEPLLTAGPGHRARVPDDVLEKGGPLLYCRVCDRVYWDGSHVKRMRNRLQAFSRGRWDMDNQNE